MPASASKFIVTRATTLFNKDGAHVALCGKGRERIMLRRNTNKSG
jgi:hypothetical protein